MTDATTPRSAIAILADKIAADETFHHIDTDLAMMVSDMTNTQEARDAAPLEEPGDEFPEPFTLGLIVVMGGEGHIIWNPANAGIDSVINADLMIDVQNAAEMAYRDARDRMAAEYDAAGDDDDEPKLEDSKINAGAAKG